MTIEEMKAKIYALIEEYSEDADELTEDEDLAAKMSSCMSMIQSELSRYKNINANKTIDVKEGDIKAFSSIDSQLYQIKLIRGVEYEIIGDSVLFNEDGKATIYYTKTPKVITDETDDNAKLEISLELQEIMPYGVAGLLLSTDPSNSYGNIFTNLYREKLQLIDPRTATANVFISGGVDI